MVRPLNHPASPAAPSADLANRRARLFGVAPERQPDDAPAPPIAAVILLAGALRPGPVQRAANRCLLDLPFGGGRTLLDIWHGQVRDLTANRRFAHLPARVLIDHHTPMPAGEPASIPREDQPQVSLSVERDPVPLRGTAGLLRDIAVDYDEDDYLLISDLGQNVLDPLWLNFRALVRVPGDVRLLAWNDGTPAGLKLVRCGCLHTLPARGFIDFNEQALPRLARTADIRVCPVDRPPPPRLRSLAGYLAALRRWHDRIAGVARAPADALQPTRSAFAVIEPGARVHHTAVIHDAVVLAGARLDAGATVVRSLVGPRARVRSGRTRIDALVT